MMSQLKILARILFCALALAPPSTGLAASALAEEPRVELRYDLRPGDHLVYRQVFERDGNNSYYGYDFLYRREWTSHVLVTGEQSGSFAVGFHSATVPAMSCCASNPATRATWKSNARI